jgi:hypothetical protein
MSGADIRWAPIVAVAQPGSIGCERQARSIRCPSIDAIG